MIQEKTPAQTFVENLARLEDGPRARLKRNAGNSLDESRDVLGLFYGQLLHNVQVSEWEEASYFLIATLYPFEKQDRQREAAAVSPRPRPASFGASLHAVRTPENSAGLDRRVERLLDADAQQLPFYLRREVRFVTNESHRPDCIDWAQLLTDVRQWDHADRFVQRKWARAYFTTRAESTANS